MNDVMQGTERLRKGRTKMLEGEISRLVLTGWTGDDGAAAGKRET